MLSKSSSSYKAHAQYRGLKKFEYICSLVHGGTRKDNNITPTAICYLSVHVPSDCLVKQPEIPNYFEQF